MAVYDVLVVDDDEATRQGLCELLAIQGFTVDQAEDGDVAWQKIARRDCVVVLLDVHLPGIDGLDLLTRCADDPRPPKVIIMTGANTTATVLNALRGKAYDFLAKPIDTARLLEVVKRAVKGDTASLEFEVVSAKPEWVELLAPCTRDAAERIQSFIHQLDADLSDEMRESIGLAFRELLLNGIEWGGQLNPTQKVRVACLRTPRMRLYRIADPGPGFTFDRLQHAADHGGDAVAHDAVREERHIRPGGFGLVLIRAFADDLIYNERQNEVVFVKYLDAGAK